ncbi:hypothetical protein KC352_g35 [Hortaea werneckii]|nr:hypothetical protein KC352_g35 [Hortaea werneckii]
MGLAASMAADHLVAVRTPRTSSRLDEIKSVYFLTPCTYNEDGRAMVGYGSRPLQAESQVLSLASRKGRKRARKADERTGLLTLAKRKLNLPKISNDQQSSPERFQDLLLRQRINWNSKIGGGEKWW